MEKEVIKDWQVIDLKAYFEDKSVSSQMYDGGEHLVFSNAPLEYFCKLTGFDYKTIMNLAIDSSWADLVYSKTEDGKYIAQCLLYIDTVLNDRLSREYESELDFLGFFTKEETKIGVARWLPSNWKELITDEQLHDILQEHNIQTIECLVDSDVPHEMQERIAKEWCKENPVTDFLSDSEKEEIAYDYMDENTNTCVNHCYEKMGSYEQKDFIKDCIDNL